MNNRKTFNFLLCLLLTLCVFLSAQAAEAVTLSLSSKTASPGEEVTVSLSISGNPGIVALTLGIEFDTSKLEFVKGTDSGFTGWSVTANQAAWVGSTDSDFNGEILTLTYKVKSNATEGNAVLTVVCGDGDMADMNENSFIPAINTGVITVEKPTPTVTATIVNTPTATFTPTFTATATSTSTATATATATPASTATKTSTPSTPTATKTAEPTKQSTATAIPTLIPEKVDRFSIWTVEDGNVTGETVFLDLAGGNALQLYALAPDDLDPYVIWRTSSVNVALVSPAGLVVGVRPGTVTITAQNFVTGITANVKIRVGSAVQPGKLQIEGPEEVAVGKSIKLTHVFNQDPQPTNRDVIWASSDEETAQVSKNGQVKGIKKGSVTISVCAKEDTTICGIKVIKVLPSAETVIIVDGIEEDGSRVIDLASVYPFYQLSAVVTPSDASQSVTWKSSSSINATVDKNGLVTGLKPGKVKITATTTDGTMKSGTIDIWIGTKVQPGSLNIIGENEVAVSKSIKLTAAFTQFPLPTNNNVVWEVDDPSIAVINKSGVLTGISHGTTNVTACSVENASICDTVEIKVSAMAQSVTIIDKEDGSRIIDAASDYPFYQLAAQVEPAEASQSVIWKSSSPSIAMVDPKGLVIALKPGTVTITATTTDGTRRYDSVKITIGNKVQPDSLVIAGPDEVAEKKKIELIAIFDQDPQPSNTGVTWSSDKEDIAQVSQSGVVTGRSMGTAVISVCSKENPAICAVKEITVKKTAEFVRIEDKEDGTFMIDIASEYPFYRLSAVVEPTAYASQDVTWRSSSPFVASVDEDGLVTAYRAGSTTITATAADGSGKSDSVRISVGNKVKEDSLVLGGPSEVAERKTIYLIAVFNQDPQPTNRRLTWTSSDETIAKVNSSGVVTGLKGGTAEITVCSQENNEICDSMGISVVPIVSSLRIIDIEDGTGMIDLASGNPIYHLDTEIEPEDASQSVTWTSSSNSIALVNESGIVVGLRAGTVTITATAADGSGKKDSIKLTVGNKVQPNSLEISGSTEVAKGKSIKLTAAFNQYPQPTNTKLEWESDNPNIARVSNTGVVNGVDTGSANITACSKENPSICDTIKIDVFPMAKSVKIQDMEDESKWIDIASSYPYYKLSAVVEPSDPPAANQTVTWRSSSPSVASVDENGLVTAYKAGSVTITATTVDGTWKSDSIRITIGNKVQQGSVLVSGPDEVAVGKSIHLTAGFNQYPQPTNTKLVWKSDDETIAKVNSSGVVTGVEGGTTRIKVCSQQEPQDICDSMSIMVLPVATSVEIFDGVGEDRTRMIDLASASPTYQLVAEVTPAYASDNVTWSSSSSAIASVDSNGLVTGHWAGTVTITATAADGSGKRATTKITVGTKVQQDSLIVTGQTKVAERKTLKLTATFNQYPQPTNTKLIWASSNASIAKVNSNGLVTGVDGGTAEITVCSQENDQICASIDITVQPLVKTLEIPEAKDQPLEIDLAGDDKTYQLGVTIDPEDASQEITWKSSSASIASVSNTGLVTGYRAGTVTITATAADGSGKSDSVRINVKAKVQPDSLKINGGDTVKVRNTLRLTAVFEQDVQPTVKTVLWSSSDPSIARVNSSGTVTGVSDGVVTITAAARDDDTVFAEKTITVGDAAAKETKDTAPLSLNEIMIDEPAYTEMSNVSDSTEAAVEISGPQFGEQEIWLKVGESVILDVLNPDNEAILVGLTGDTDAVLWDESLNMVTSIGPAEVSAFLSTIDPFEVKDMAAIHVVAELPEALTETTAENAETPAEGMDLPQDVMAAADAVSEEAITADIQPTETAAEQTSIEENEVPAEVTAAEVQETAVPASDEQTLSGNDAADNIESLSEGQPETLVNTEEAVETDAAASSEKPQISIRDLGEYDALEGTAGSMLTIERERFELDDEVLKTLIFEIENEAIAVLTNRTVEEMLVHGIEIRLLNEGETKLLIKQEGEAEPLREIRLVVKAALTAETEVPAVIETEEPTAVSQGEADTNPSVDSADTQNNPAQTEESTAPEAEAVPVFTEEPTAEPAAAPTEEPTAEPVVEFTEEPTAEPTEAPTAEPAAGQTADQTGEDAVMLDLLIETYEELMGFTEG